LSGWKTVTLADVVERAGTWNPSRSAPDQTLTYIDLGAVDQDLKQITGAREVMGGEAPSRARQLVASGDVLVSTVRPNLNGVARVPQELDRATASTGFCVLRARSTVLDGGYLFNWVKAPGFVTDMVGKATGASYPAISDRIVLESRLPLPQLSEQQRIAEVLDRGEALRTMRRKALAQLDSIVKAVFFEMFGSLDGNVVHWPMRPVSHYVAEFQGGKSIEAESDESAATRNRVLKISAVTGMKYRPNESKPVPDTYEPPPTHFVRPGDLLFSRANTTKLVGAVAYVDETPPNVLLPDKLWRFIWRQPLMVEPLFVWTMFQTPALRREIERRATGTSGSMKNISQHKLLGIETILPPLSRQREFARRIRAVDGLRESHRASLAELDALFAVLQHRAFRGEL
jgi:type I restriction enzyme S subunit